MPKIAPFLVWILLLLCSWRVDGFVSRPTSISAPLLLLSNTARRSKNTIFLMDQEEQDMDIGFQDDEDDDDDDDDDEMPWKKNARWNSLSPKVKLRIIEEAQERAVSNKKKREPKQDKQRRMMMFVKKSQVKRKRASRVKRPLPFSQRTPLSALSPGTNMTGTVISLKSHGAFVDVGTECDGLLHVSQISDTFFVEHPRQVMSPGDEVSVRISSLNPELKKLHLTMLPEVEGEEDEDDDEESIPLEEIEVDDELWGEIKRVTDFGAYVELGAVVDGFLHFMDHPEFGATAGAPPSDFMAVGDRIRVWVSDLDMDKTRIKLTANRPSHLPGPRREIF